MSVNLTEQAVRDRTKTVTRRLGWEFLKPGDRLTLCLKVQGRRRSNGIVEPLVRLAEVEVVAAYRVRLSPIMPEEVVREGFPDWTPRQFVEFFCQHMKCAATLPWLPGSSGDTSMAEPTIVRRTVADDENQVLSVEGGRGQYRRQPCGGCPWRVDQTGEFPAEAFRISAPTAHDMSDRMFGCHESGPANPSTCAGFLLRGADHNLAVRMASATGQLNLHEVTDGGHELHRSYRVMAEQNGVDPDDYVLRPCRDPFEVEASDGQ